MSIEGDEGGDPSLRDELERELRKAQSELAENRVEASAGGGAVKVIMSGTQECLDIAISPELLAAGDADRLQGLVLLAVNQAIRDSQLMAARRLSPFSGDLDP